MMSRLASAAPRRRRVARIGVAVPQHARALGEERLRDARRHEHGAHRQVTARDALRAGHEVGVEPPPRAREPVAVRPNPVMTSSATNSTPVSRQTRARAARGSRRAAGRRRPRRSPARRRTRPPGRRRAARSSRGATSASSQRHLLDIGQQRSVAGRVRRDPGSAVPADMHPVVRALAAEQDRALGLPDELPVAPRHLRRGVDRVGAAARQEHPAVGHGASDATRSASSDAGRFEVAEGRVRRERAHLGGGRVGDVRRGRSRRCSTRGPRSHRGSAARRSSQTWDALAAHEDELAVRGRPTPCRRTDARSGPCGRGYQRYRAGRVDGTSGRGRSLSPCRTPGSGGANAPPRAMLSPRRRA